MIEEIREKIIEDPQNKEYTDRGILPLFAADKESKILIIGQAPGIKAQETGILFKDKSGERLMETKGNGEDVFRDPKKISILPMDFYFPGKGKSGDNPPRKDFAEKWHPLLLEEMENIELRILIGKYVIDYYLKGIKEKNLTETVRSYEKYLPKYFPIVHPSPLNFRWLKKNPWYEEKVVPELKKKVKEILK